MEDGDDIWSHDVLPSVQIEGHGWHQRISMQSSISCSLFEVALDDFRAGGEEQQREVRFASVDEQRDPPVGASAVC